MTDLSARYQDVERALASCVLASGNADVIEAVDSEQIADPVARGIITAAAQLHTDGRKVDAVTVSLLLAHQHADWPAKVADVLTHPGAVWSNWSAYAAAVCEGHHRRRAVEAAERIMQAAEQSDMAMLVEQITKAAALALDISAHTKAVA